MRRPGSDPKRPTRSRVGKLQPVCEVQPAAVFVKLGCIGTQSHSFVHMLSHYNGRVEELLRDLMVHKV